MINFSGKGSMVGMDEIMTYTHDTPFTVNKISVGSHGRHSANWLIPKGKATLYIF